MPVGTGSSQRCQYLGGVVWARQRVQSRETCCDVMFRALRAKFSLSSRRVSHSGGCGVEPERIARIGCWNSTFLLLPSWPQLAPLSVRLDIELLERKLKFKNVRRALRDGDWLGCEI